MGLVHKLGISPDIQEAFFYFTCLTCALFVLLFDAPMWGILLFLLLIGAVSECLWFGTTGTKGLAESFFRQVTILLVMACLIGLYVLGFIDPAVGGSILLQGAAAFMQPIIAAVAYDKLIKLEYNKVNRLMGWASIAALYLVPFFVL